MTVTNESLVRIGGLGPLTWPGVPWAGRELRDGMELAVRRLNDSGGVLGQRLVLQFEDTNGRPDRSVAAVNRLIGSGVSALAGEFHSVVADALVDVVEHSKVPFVCASATLDDITARRPQFVFRLAPPQSYGWRIYADFLASRGHRHVVALQDDNFYWNSGSRVIETRLAELGVAFTRLLATAGHADALSWIRKVEATRSDSPACDALLLLVGYPEPLQSVVREAKNHGLVPAACTLGDPAGRAVFMDWWEIAGADAIGVPFLSYMPPEGLTRTGKSVVTDFQRQHGREPTFVALEGYDSVVAVAHAMRDAGRLEPLSIRDALQRVRFEGSRSLVSFSTEPAGVVHQQWKWPPVCVASHRRAYEAPSEADIVWIADSVLPEG